MLKRLYLKGILLKEVIWKGILERANKTINRQDELVDLVRSDKYPLNSRQW